MALVFRSGAMAPNRLASVRHLSYLACKRGRGRNDILSGLPRLLEPWEIPLVVRNVPGFSASSSLQRRAFHPKAYQGEQNDYAEQEARQSQDDAQNDLQRHRPLLKLPYETRHFRPSLKRSRAMGIQEALRRMP